MKIKFIHIAVLYLFSIIICGCNNNRKADIMKINSQKINKTCPVRVDSLLILDSTYYNKEDNSMTYYYTASGILDDSLLLNKNYNEIESSLREGLDNSVDMRKYIEYEVTIIYKYNSYSNGKTLVTFTMPNKRKTK